MEEYCEGVCFYDCGYVCCCRCWCVFVRVRCSYVEGYCVHFECEFDEDEYERDDQYWCVLVFFYCFVDVGEIGVVCCVVEECEVVEEECCGERVEEEVLECVFG